jgi:hypothetical protein
LNAANMFVGARCIGERKVKREDCFISIQHSLKCTKIPIVS